jgi:hypothetical protein
VTATLGTLGGNGVIGGAVTIQSNARLSPGASIGMLTISNNLTLVANSTTLMEISKSLLTNDQVNVTGALTCGGNLVVTNLSGTLTAGDSFKLFNAGSYSSTFTSFSLPALLTGLAWNTNALTNGTLSVIATVSPSFNQIVPAGDGNFQLSGYGTALLAYELDAATNLAAPVFWQFVTNTTSDVNGFFEFIDPQATNFPQRFYRVIAP